MTFHHKFVAGVCELAGWQVESVEYSFHLRNLFRMFWFDEIGSENGTGEITQLQPVTARAGASAAMQSAT